MINVGSSQLCLQRSLELQCNARSFRDLCEVLTSNANWTHKVLLAVPIKSTINSKYS